MNNSGFISHGAMNVGQLAVGTHAQINNGYDASGAGSRRRGIGVVTIKAVEMRAVIDVFGLAKATGNGQTVYTGRVESADGTADLTAVRALEQGQRSAMPALQYLRQHHDPAVYVVVGIGGGIDDDLQIGDVVVANRVVYYELRRETADGVFHRGEERHTPAAITQAVNTFFTEHHEPARLRSTAGPFHVHPGPLASGDAVVMDREGPIRRFLKSYNEKILAVDTEAGGLAQFCHETPVQQPGWLVVRGISDLADHAKNETHQPSAARNAAITLQHLIPYLPANVGSPRSPDRNHLP